MATLFEQTGFNASDGWNNFTARVFIPSSFLSGTASAVQVKLAYYNTSWSFGKVYIGHKASSGDAYDFDGNQVQLLFSGSASGTVGSGGLLSDTVAFDFDSSKDILISFYLPSSITVPKLSISNIIVYGKADVDEAATTDVTSYTGYTSQLQMVEGIYSATAPLTAEISDNATVSEIFDGLIDGLSENATVDDNISAGLYLTSEISDNAIADDAFAAWFGYEAEITDDATASDDFQVTRKYPETLTETLDFSDSNLVSWLKEITDSIFVYDAIQNGWAVTAESTIDLADAIETVLGIIVDEWLTLIDSQVNNWTGREIVTESITLWEIAQGVKVYSDSLTDTIDMADTSAYTLSIAILEYLGFTDLAAAMRTTAASVSDSMGIADSSAWAFPLLAESILDLVDASTVITTFLNSVQSDLGLADVSSLIARVSNTVTESIVFVDSVASKGTLYNILYDTLALNVTIELNGEIWECYVLNTPRLHPSMYSGFDFNSYCVFENRAFGANDTGIYELTGDTDAGATIHTGAILNETDFGAPNQKRFRRGYLGISGANPVMVFETEDGTRQAYNIDSQGKFVASHELKSKKWKLSIAEFDSIDSINLIPVILTK